MPQSGRTPIEHDFTVKNILTQKVPILGLLFVSVLAIEIKCSDFHFCKKENTFIYATVQFYLIFLNSSWYKNALKTPEVIYRFCRTKSSKLLDLNALKILCNE